MSQRNHQYHYKKHIGAENNRMDPAVLQQSQATEKQYGFLFYYETQYSHTGLQKRHNTVSKQEWQAANMPVMWRGRKW